MGASEKRKDYISWDEYFMGIAMLSGMRSKDPNTQVGAVLSVRIIRFYLWDIMDCRRAAQMMSSPGPERERITSISILHTASSMPS